MSVYGFKGESTVLFQPWHWNNCIHYQCQNSDAVLCAFPVLLLGILERELEGTTSWHTQTGYYNQVHIQNGSHTNVILTRNMTTVGEIFLVFYNRLMRVWSAVNGKGGFWIARKYTKGLIKYLWGDLRKISAPLERIYSIYSHKDCPLPQMLPCQPHAFH